MDNLHERILIVEDDPQIRSFIHYALEAEGYRCQTAASGSEALGFLVAEPYDMMLLDLGLPDMDGTEVLTKVREWSDIPVIIVSARDQDKEKVRALDLGADDYLTKPFSASELMARIRVALRHLYRSGGHASAVFTVGDLQLDAEKRLVYLEGHELHLTPMEYSLLLLLFKNHGKVMTTATILK